MQESTYKYKDELMKAVRKLYRGAASYKKGDYLQIAVNDKKQAKKVELLIQKYNKLKGLNLKAKYHLQPEYDDPKYNVNLHRITILEAKGAPKMKSSPFVQKVRDVGLDLARIASRMGIDDPNGFAKSKKSYEKAVKALQLFQLDVTRHGKNY